MMIVEIDIVVVILTFICHKGGWLNLNVENERLSELLEPSLMEQLHLGGEVRGQSGKSEIYSNVVGMVAPSRYFHPAPCSMLICKINIRWLKRMSLTSPLAT